MDSTFTLPTGGQPLTQVSPERENRKSHTRENSSPKSQVSHHVRESSINERASRFDVPVSQAKTLERKTNDAALKRAMLGREEAEAEVGRYRDEARALREKEDDNLLWKSKMEEKYQALVEKYSRTKETHQHTEKLWNEQIRRSRKEAFKSSSLVVKLQEELKSSRTSLQAAGAENERERTRSKAREQEAFEARYQLVGAQEELAQMMEKLKLLEQERDALKTIAKEEEIARIAAEGKIPLPIAEIEDEFSSPRKSSAQFLTVDVFSSAASEAEIDGLKWELMMERQRAERAYDHIDFMRLECQMGICTCRMAEKSDKSFVHVTAPPASAPLLNTTFELQSLEIKGEEEKKIELYEIAPHQPSDDSESSIESLNEDLVFISEEGVFRRREEALSQPTSPARSMKKIYDVLPPKSPIHQSPPRILHIQPREQAQPVDITSVVHDDASLPPSVVSASRLETKEETANITRAVSVSTTTSEGTSTYTDAQSTFDTINQNQPEDAFPQLAPSPPIHFPKPSPTSLLPSPTFHTISTTTRIPLADPPSPTPKQMTINTKIANAPPIQDPEVISSFDRSDNAFTPTMSREEALAMIRERRGRAKSLAQGNLTPRKQMMEGGVGIARRDVSAPAVRAPSRGREVVDGSKSVGRSVSRGRGLLGKS